MIEMFSRNHVDYSPIYSKHKSRQLRLTEKAGAQTTWVARRCWAKRVVELQQRRAICKNNTIVISPARETTRKRCSRVLPPSTGIASPISNSSACHVSARIHTTVHWQEYHDMTCSSAIRQFLVRSVWPAPNAFYESSWPWPNASARFSRRYGHLNFTTPQSVPFFWYM